MVFTRPGEGSMRKFCLLTILLTIVHCFAHAAQAPEKLKIYSNFNNCVDTLKLEWPDDGLWFKLRESILNDPPEHIKSLDRIEIEKELIKLHEKRLAYLKDMLDLEKR
jgi:hypothetical protein